MRNNFRVIALLTGLLIVTNQAAYGADSCEKASAGDPALKTLSAECDTIAEKTGANSVIQVNEKTCDAIDKAIQKLPPEGGTVMLSSGTYLCSYPVIVNRDNVSIVGAGSGKTTLKAKDATAIPVLIVGSTNNTYIVNGIPYPDRVTKNINISGLTIDGNYHSNPHPGNFECWNPATNTSMSCAHDDGNLIRNNGLTVRRTEGLNVNDLVTKSNYSGGIVTEKLCKNLVMDNFSSSDNWFDGFAGYETTKSTFSHFKVFNNRFSGTSTDANFSGNTFVYGQAVNNGDNGVFSNNVNNNVYSHMTVNGNKNKPFYINQEQKGRTCEGNEIDDSVISGVKPVYIDHGCTGMKLNHVQITQSNGQCTWFHPDTQATISGGSTCTDSTGKTVSIDGEVK